MCDDKANTDALYFNKGVLQIVNELNAELPSAEFTYLDVYRAFGEVVAQPQQYGNISLQTFYDIDFDFGHSHGWLRIEFVVECLRSW